jgi:hypothetical protein
MKMPKICFNAHKVFILVLWMPLCSVYSQDLYQSGYADLSKMLNGDKPISFKEAVILTENAYLDGIIDKAEVDKLLNFLTNLCIGYKKANSLQNYSKSDKPYIETVGAVFKVVTDTTTIILPDSQVIYHYPFRYDFDDIFGSKDWSNMFVTKLLATHSGNCHSIPYLYKMICDELKVPCHLALAPNHIYIKHRSIKAGMYNTELTSAAFPIDAWLMASGYISLEAVQNRIFMDTLSEKENIALCVIDLANGFDHKYPDNDGKFVIECCDLALKYFPNYINAMMLKAETRLRQLKQMQKRYGYAYLKEVTYYPEGKTMWDEMNLLYGKMLKLGYRNMPEQMYVDWLVSLKTEKEKYTNKQVEQMNRN